MVKSEYSKSDTYDPRNYEDPVAELLVRKFKVSNAIQEAVILFIFRSLQFNYDGFPTLPFCNWQAKISYSNIDRPMI